MNFTMAEATNQNCFVKFRLDRFKIENSYLGKMEVFFGGIGVVKF